MGLIVFVWFVLATFGNDENDFVDGKALELKGTTN
jgi:hypothetical protein